MSVNPQTTGYLNWHIAYTGNDQGVRVCCFGEVTWVDNAFCKQDIQVDLFLVLVRTTCFAGACISGVSLYTRLDPDICVPLKVLMLLGKYHLSTTMMTFTRRRACWTNAIKASTSTRSLPDGQVIAQ